MARCKRCRCLLRKPSDVVDWLWLDGSASPKLCDDCYDYLMDNVNEEMTDVEIAKLIGIDENDNSDV